MRDFYFGIFQLDIRRSETFDLANFLLVVHGMQHHSAFVGTQKHRVLAVVHGELCNGDELALLKRLGQQRIRAAASFLGHHVIGGLEVNRIDFTRFHELEDFHCLGCFGFNFLDLFGLDDHVFILPVLVALHDFAAIQNLIVERANELLLHAMKIGAMKLVK